MPKARVRHTCTECSLRRQQCDRKIPCARCIKRGTPEKCRLTWEGGTYDPARHRVYPTNHARRRSSPISVLAEDSDLTQNGDSEDSADASIVLGASLVPREQSMQEAAPTASRPRYVWEPWVRPRIRKNAEQPAPRYQSLLAVSTAASANRASVEQEAHLQALLPNAEHLWMLVDYHEQYLLWYHCCYHGPSFRAELESVFEDQEDRSILDVAGLDLQWLALLFSIITGSLTCTAEWRLREWGFSQDESMTLSKQWYRAALNCLSSGEWTSVHSVSSVQAVTTLVISAHSLGQSAEMAVLLAAATKVAQYLGLASQHYDENIEHIDTDSSDAQRDSMLKRDIARKLWLQLCVQDWMSLPFAGTHIISPDRFSSDLPSTRDYLTMESLPSTTPTYASYGNYLFRIAKLVMQHDEASLKSKTPYTKYQHVLEFDAQMRNLATAGMPRYFHVIEPVHAQWPEWVHWARSSLTVCFAHKVILIHRDYIRQSFTNPAYSVTKSTCVAAAKTILNEAKTRDLRAPIIWVDKAYCIAAALILCLDCLHRSSADADYSNHRRLVTDCMERLEVFENSTIAARGSALLDVVLSVVDRAGNGDSSVLRDLLGEELISKLSTLMPEAGPRLQDLLPPPAGFTNRRIFDDLFQQAQ